ncbi:MAG: helicase HerA domain-containing protein [Anaerolineae bacterium]
MTITVRPGAFYLGREVDPAGNKVLVDKPILYNASDLTTHAVCVGMTGSGKTGLCIDLLEEAALNGIPSIIIDPKGDMGNLLLTFPNLAPADFLPWVNLEDAQRAGLSEAELAAKTASTWAKGLAEWDQDGTRIQRLRDAAEFVIYTPGSKSGLPVNVLRSFQAPQLKWDDEEDALRELIAAIVSALLGLLGVEADPLRSREHILLSNILEYAWRQDQDVDMPRLIGYIQKPPMKKLGVFDVDTFYPEKDRFSLAMGLNAVVAAPSFQNWMQGTPLDIAQILRTPQGKPRIAIFSIGHLSDAERMFFVSLLLEQVIAWMRQLSGTSSLRSLLYFDEVFGFFPPDKNPPSKTPLLTLMKTARAFGLGIVLATQNPIDLDYKGLTNAGTWFIGKLQTTYDKQRLLDGMQGVVTQSGSLLDRKYMDDTISSLAPRTFVLHSVYAPKPVLMRTRWAMSYLRGPLTRSQIQTLMAPFKASTTATSQTPGSTNAVSSAPTQVASVVPQTPSGYSTVRPQVNSRVSQFFMPVDITAASAMQGISTRLANGLRVQGAWMAYEPYLVGIASAIYADATRSQVKEQRTACLMPLPEQGAVLNWAGNLVDNLTPEALQPNPVGEAIYGVMPAGMTESPPYTQLKDTFLAFVNRERSLPIYVNSTLGLRSVPGESEDVFGDRCATEAGKKAEAEVIKLLSKLEADVDRLKERLDREKDALEKSRAEYEGRKSEEFMRGGETIVGLFLGRRSTRALSSASRGRRMTAEAKADLQRSERRIQELTDQVAQLQADGKEAVKECQQKWQEIARQITSGALRTKKSDIRLEAAGLVWVPFWLIPVGDARGVSRYERVSAVRMNQDKGK